MTLIETDWKWRAMRFKEILAKEELDVIVGSMFSGFPQDRYDVEVLSVGHSGAHVLKVIGTENGQKQAFLLKIIENETEVIEEEKAASRLKYTELPPNIFIGAKLLESKKVYQWYCLLFHFATGQSTLRQHLREMCLEPNVMAVDFLEKVEANWRIFENYHASSTRLVNGINPYLGIVEARQANSSIYKGLYLRGTKRWLIFQTLELLDKWYLSHQNSLLFNQKDLERFKSFLLSDRGEYDGVTITQFSKEGTPLAVVHGDFHTANILASSKGEEVSFIDFANMLALPIRHALSDWGKLSSDLEISVLPEKTITNQTAQLEDWIITHRQWLNGQAMDSKNAAIQALYSWNTQILNIVLDKRTTLFRLSETEAIRQFHMIRLHYFLKALSYQYECREKLVFLLHASTDILKFLTKAPQS